MKSLPLTDDNVKNLFKKELKSEDLAFFMNNLSEFKHLWKQQNHEFWIKFVTSLRFVVFFQKNYKPEISDAIFVEFLKKLTGKSFDPLLKQILSVGEKLKYKPKKNSYDSSSSDEEERPICHAKPKKELPEDQFEQRQVLESRCMAAFIKLHGLWRNAVDGTDTEWQEPFLWLTRAFRAKPFEEFLKSRWKEGLLSKIGHKEEEIFWWNERPIVKPPPPKPIIQQTVKPQKSVQHEKTKDSTTKKPTPLKPTESSRASTSTAASSKIKKEKREYSNENFYKFNRSSRSDLWLPEKRPRLKYITLPNTNEVKNYNFFEMLLRRKDGYDSKWFSLEESFPPLLGRRFHIIDPSIMYEPQTDMHHLATCTWFCSWNEVFGASLLAFLQIQIKEQENVDTMGSFPYTKSTGYIMDGWTFEMRSLVVALTEGQRCHWSGPLKSECVETAKEFLLEPCVIIQLPWKIVMLQQWLGTALIEIMKFEIESMELRYWPLERGEVEECARELLWMISCAKQQVLLGLYLLVSQVQNKIVPSPLIPSLIMDSVVLPTLPVLKFLCSGEALQALLDLKHAAFAKPHPIRNSVTLPESAFRVQDNLQEFYANHHWHVNFWLTDENLEPYPYLEGEMNFREVVGRLKTGVPPPNKSIPAQTPDISKEESVVHELWVTLNFENKVLADVLKSIADPRRVIKILCKLGFFSESDEEKLCTLILGNKSDRSYLRGFVRYSELFALTTFPLTGIGQHDTVLSWLVRLSGEVLEREQLARLVATCSLLLGQAPTLPGIEKVTCLHSPSHWLKTTRQVQKQVTTIGRNWLWQQLPLPWRQTFTPVYPAPDPSQNLESIASNLAVRVGKIILGVAQNSFNIHTKGCEEFKRWQVVQYVVPGFITCLLDVARNANTPENQPRIKNLVAMLHTMVEYYEVMYADWLKYAPRRATRVLVPYFNKEREDQHKSLQKFIITSEQMAIRHSRIAQLLTAYVGLASDLEGIPGYESWLDGAMWIFVSRAPDVWNGTIALLTNALVDHCLPSFDDLLNICCKAWKVPEPGSQLLAGPMLSKIYLANAALEEIRGLIVVQGTLKPALAKTALHMSVTNNSFNPRSMEWCFTLMSLVAQSQKSLPMQEDVTLKKIEIFASDGQNILLEMCSALVKLRKMAGEWKWCDVSMITQPSAFSKVSDLISLYKCGKTSALERSLELVQYTGVGAGKIRYEMIPVGCKDTDSSLEHAPQVASNQDMESNAVEEVHEISEASNVETTANPTTLQKCRQCSKEEEKPGSFIVCSDCEKQNYPDPNFYCTELCKDTRWKEEHFAEHLEFELGLLDFNAP